MSQINRRSVVRGAAWSVPVVAAAAHAPAYAASTDAPAIPNAGAFSVCRNTGEGQSCQGYRFTLALSVQPSDTWDIVLTDVRIGGAQLLLATTPREFAVTATSNVITFDVCGNFSASQISFTLKYSATNRRTVVTTTDLGGTYAISGIKQCA
ncbi:hypothetical protein [Nocardioides xinjiangensis]|uniref:hypothetical protein n=1 Tax=Nocardioides xinjiangensis TaxID=2817376 RepID=UPI001B30262A|nr:hypothetical protein [Nocardioides sp. SYSU D00778]